MLRVDPRDESDLLWFFNDAEGEIKGLESTHNAAVAQLIARANCKDAPPFRYRQETERGPVWHATENVGFVCGRVYVPNETAHAAAAHALDGRALAAVRKEARIRGALVWAGDGARGVLRLRYLKGFRPCRLPFGYSGGFDPYRPVERGSHLSYEETVELRLRAMHGVGSVAHLTDVAQVAHGRARTTVGLERWTDRLGQKLASGGASAVERGMQGEFRHQAEQLVLAAYKEYRRARGGGRVPELVRRRAAARA
jgi:hypothetical protein